MEASANICSSSSRTFIHHETGEPTIMATAGINAGPETLHRLAISRSDHSTRGFRPAHNRLRKGFIVTKHIAGAAN